MRLLVDGELSPKEKAQLKSLGLVERTAYLLRQVNRHREMCVTTIGFEEAISVYSHFCEQERLLPEDVTNRTEAKDWFVESPSGSSWITCELITQAWVNE